MKLWLLVGICMLGAFPRVAAAQYPPGYAGPAGGMFAPAPLGAIPAAGAMPNYFNRQYQPLSPYLNLLRGGNPAVNYFYGVRPGLMANGRIPGGAPLGTAAGMAYQSGFLPVEMAPGEPIVAAPAGAVVTGFQPIGPATFSTGLTRFGGVANPAGTMRPTPPPLPPAQPARPARRR